MELLNLHLNNFRNFSTQKIEFDQNLSAGRQGLSVIIGPNGSGKTNILEAISVLCGRRSSRVDTDCDLVKFNKSEAKIGGVIESFDTKNKLIVNFLVIDERYVKKAYFVDSIKKK